MSSGSPAAETNGTHYSVYHPLLQKPRATQRILNLRFDYSHFLDLEGLFARDYKYVFKSNNEFLCAVDIQFVKLLDRNLIFVLSVRFIQYFVKCATP